MAKQSADVKLTVSQRAAVAALDHFQRRFDSMTKKMASATKRTARSTKETSDNIGKLPGQFVKAAAGCWAFNKALQYGSTMSSQIVAKLEESARIVLEANESKVGYQEYLMQGAQIIPKTSNLNVDQIDKRIRNARTSSPKNVARAFMAAVSATSEMPVDQRLQTTIETAKMRPDLLKSFPDAFEELVKAIVQSRAMIKDVNNTTYAQAGLINLGQSASKVTDPRLFAQNIVPLGFQMQNYGVNQGEAFALASAVGQKSGDTEGAITTTGILNAFKALTVNAKSAGIHDVSGMDLLEKTAFSQEKKFKNLRNTMLGAFSEDPDFRKAMSYSKMSKTSLTPELGQRAKTFLPWVELLQGKQGPESAWAMYSQAIGEMGLKRSSKYRINMPESFKMADAYQRQESEKLRKSKALTGMFSGESAEAFSQLGILNNNRGAQGKYLLKILEASQNAGLWDDDWFGTSQTIYGPGKRNAAGRVSGPMTPSDRAHINAYMSGIKGGMSEEEVINYGLDITRRKQMSAIGVKRKDFLDVYKRLSDPSTGMDEIKSMYDLTDTQERQIRTLESIEAILREDLQKVKPVRIDNPVVGPSQPGAAKLGGGE